MWTGAVNLAPIGIRSPGRPALSQSLYRLSYPTHIVISAGHINNNCDFFTYKAFVGLLNGEGMLFYGVVLKLFLKII